MISPFLVNVCLAWYLLLLDFGTKGEVSEGLSTAIPTSVVENSSTAFRTWLPRKMAARGGRFKTRASLVSPCMAGDGTQDGATVCSAERGSCHPAIILAPSHSLVHGDGGGVAEARENIVLN